MKTRYWLLALLLLAGFNAWLLVAPGEAAQAAVFWADAESHTPFSEGVLGRDVSLCFVGSAVTAEATRVNQILDYIAEFEYVANIHFVTVGGGIPVAQAAATNMNLLKCPPDSGPPGGNDFYAGDIRMMIPGSGYAWTTGAVPGTGCPMTSQPGGSWGNEPWLLNANRSCLWNLRLGNDSEDLRTGIDSGVPWLNHTLHEVGHSLGFGHEHARSDENANCINSSRGDYHVYTKGFMTPYDKDSVMHYQFTVAETPLCNQIGSNYSNSGFTRYDRIALRILYPEDVRVAEFVGTTVIRVGQPLKLTHAWITQGANINVVARNFLWKLDGATIGTQPTLNYVVGPEGIYTLEFSFDDMIGRRYTYSGKVHVLTDQQFFDEIVGPIAANLPLMYPNYVYIPNIKNSMQPAQNATLVFPSGLFNQPIVIDYASQPPQNASARSHIGFFYSLNGTNLGDGQPAQIQPGGKYSVTLTYDPAVLPPGTREGNLGLYFWNLDPALGPTRAWIKEPTSMVNPAANYVMATPNHFSLWAIFDNEKMYVPFVRR